MGGMVLRGGKRSIRRKTRHYATLSTTVSLGLARDRILSSAIRGRRQFFFIMAIPLCSSKYMYVFNTIRDIINFTF